MAANNFYLYFGGKAEKRIAKKLGTESRHFWFDSAAKRNIFSNWLITESRGGIFIYHGHGSNVHTLTKSRAEFEHADTGNKYFIETNHVFGYSIESIYCFWHLPEMECDCVLSRMIQANHQDLKPMPHGNLLKLTRVVILQVEQKHEDCQDPLELIKC
jgi:hypothetical protein